MLPISWTKENVSESKEQIFKTLEEKIKYKKKRKKNGL